MPSSDRAIKARYLAIARQEEFPAMTKQMFELKPEELRAVIGGATYYSAVNKLPAFPFTDVLMRSSASFAADRPATR